VITSVNARQLSLSQVDEAVDVAALLDVFTSKLGLQPGVAVALPDGFRLLVFFLFVGWQPVVLERNLSELVQHAAVLGHLYLPGFTRHRFVQLNEIQLGFLLGVSLSSEVGVVVFEAVRDLSCPLDLGEPLDLTSLHLIDWRL